MADTAYEPRLKSEYRQRIRKTLTDQFGYTNEMQIPKLDKVVVNMGIGEAVTDSKKTQSAMKDLAAITGQKPAPTKARHNAFSPNSSAASIQTSFASPHVRRFS